MLYRHVEATVTREDGEAVATRADRFRALCEAIEPRLRRALVAAYGPELGSEATADALSWAWEHFDRVEAMTNPAGYLWRVGQTSVRGATSHRSWATTDRIGPVVSDGGPDYEPALLSALATLSPRQRTAVLLVHGYGYSFGEAADAMQCRIRTLRHHLDRGLTKLRLSLGVTADG